MSNSGKKTPDRDDELEHLLAHACDDILDIAEHEDLGNRLRSDPEARRAYLEAMAMERMLQAEHEDSMLSVADAMQAASLSDQSSLHTLRSEVVNLFWPEDSRRLWAVGSIAASLLIATLAVQGWIRLNHDTSVMQAQRPTFMQGKPVGRIVDVSNVQWEAGDFATSDDIVGGQVLRIREGTAELELVNGARLTVTGPAELEVVSSTLMKARSGIYRATSGAEDDEFVLETPTTHVVKYAPNFANSPGKHAGVGVEIDKAGLTDVVVFDGEVSLQMVDGTVVSDRHRSKPEISYHTLRSVRRLGMGEGLRVGSGGNVHRIVSLDDSRFPFQADTSEAEQHEIIRSVSDDFRDPNGAYYYKVLHREFGEDARAFVDRFHEWNSVDPAGMPTELVGADYVMTFNNDKWSPDTNLHVELAAPAWLYVFMDDRVPAPSWLVDRFSDTGWDIGLDEGWYAPNGRRATLSRTGKLVPLSAPQQAAVAGTRFGELDSTFRTQQGPAHSVDAVYSVWRLEVDRAGRVTLGPPGEHSERTSMYGIAATPKHAPGEADEIAF